MLFELLTGRQPYTGDTPLTVAHRHVDEVVPAPSTLVPGLPPALDSLVALATSRNPELRPADAGQFLYAVTGARHGLPPDLPPPPALPGTSPGASASVSNAETAPPLPVVAPAWPNSPATAWPGTQPPAYLPIPHSSPSAQPAGQSGGWPVPPQNDHGPDLIPGMARVPAAQSYGALGTERAYGPYRPNTNNTLIVSPADDPYQNMAPAREPWLSGLLFSRRLAYLAAALAVVVVFGLLGWWLFEGRYTVVPKVTGVATATAQADLRNAGLTPGATRTALDNNVAKGLIVKTIPANGSRIARGGHVTLVVSAGPHMIKMPQVTGLKLTDAQAAIKHAGLVPGKVKLTTSATIAAGIVISTSPNVGTSWPQPKPVTIVLSAGPPVPNFVGQQKAVAEQWATASGVNLNEVTTASDQPVDMVIKQSVRPGSAFTAGQVITVTISTGPPMVGIPNLDGQRVPKAVSILRRLGFVVQINQVGPFNMVFDYNPKDQAPKGSTITLTTGFPHFGG
jgi:serine/threonine-protein kinase